MIRRLKSLLVAIMFILTLIPTPGFAAREINISDDDAGNNKNSKPVVMMNKESGSTVAGGTKLTMTVTASDTAPIQNIKYTWADEGEKEERFERSDNKTQFTKTFTVGSEPITYILKVIATNSVGTTERTFKYIVEEKSLPEIAMSKSNGSSVDAGSVLTLTIKAPLSAPIQNIKYTWADGREEEERLDRSDNLTQFTKNLIVGSESKIYELKVTAKNSVGTTEETFKYAVLGQVEDYLEGDTNTDTDKVYYVRAGITATIYESLAAAKAAMGNFESGVNESGMSVKNAAEQAKNALISEGKIKDKSDIAYVFLNSENAKYCDNTSNEYLFEIGIAKQAPTDVHLEATLSPIKDEYDIGSELVLDGHNCVDHEEKNGEVSITSHKVNIKLENFEIDNKREWQLLEDDTKAWDKETIKAVSWNTSGVISSIDEGKLEGKITVSCNCNKNCNKVFIIKFKPIEAPTELHLTATLTPGEDEIYNVGSKLALDGYNCVTAKEENGKWYITSHKVKIHLDNFEISNKREWELLEEDGPREWNKERITAKLWNTSGSISSIDEGATEGIITVSCDECYKHCKVVFHIHFGEPEEPEGGDPSGGGGNPPPEDDDTLTHNYTDKEEHLEDEEEHLEASFHSNRNNGEGRDTLYMLGDTIWLSGTDCIHVMHYWSECTSETYKYYTDEGYYTKDSDGNLTWHSNWVLHIDTLPGCGGYKEGSEKWVVDYYPIKIKLDGFTLDNKSEINLTDFAGTEEFKSPSFSAKNWETDAGMKITSISNDHYDASSGTHYGIIEVTCKCCKGECKREFVVYFGDSRPVPSSLKVNISPKNYGFAKVTGLFQEGESYKKGTRIVYDSERFSVLSGSDYVIEPFPAYGKNYKNITLTQNGKEISKESPYCFKMPDELDLTVNFDDNVQNYTLYVTSNEGGKAWTDDRPEGTNYEKYIYDGKTLGDKISNVLANTEFQLKESALKGYSFNRYEYRPFVNESAVGKFSMPRSDLTATGIFKKDKEEKTNPKLTVITNNPEWGTAYAQLNGSKLTSPSEVTPGQKCEIKFEPKAGYYFTNWEYDSEESPFIDSNNNIQMPNYDLKIIAFFAPIPGGSEFGKNVKFVAEAIDINDKIIPGVIPGIVPENLEKIKKNESVTFGVTANKGYKFIKWYFTDENNKEIYPKTSWTQYGSGYFSMPDQNIIAHAVFRRTVTLEILINGNGHVYLNNQMVNSGFKTELVQGSKVNLIGKALVDNKFKFWEFSTGAENNKDQELRNYVINEDMTITANFGPKEFHTLYVTYGVGGTASPTKYPAGKNVEDFYKDGKHVGYMIKNLKEGEKVTIVYEITNEEYRFQKWEYSPYIKASETYKTTAITMPDSDLTVTAEFINDNTKSNPQLIVTTNNPEWGRAYALNDAGKPMAEGKWTSAKVDTDYKLVVKPSDDCYFVKWQYSTTDTPFIGTDTIKMPNKNLEVMAIFAQKPIPKGSHKIDFEAVPPEGGSVPQDLDNISAGSKITIGVTPNMGWKFLTWEFKDRSGNKINYKLETYWESDGSGYFIMPDYDVVAEAIFERVTYKLYIVYRDGGKAWTYDTYGKDPETEVVEVDAIPGKSYKVYYRADDETDKKWKMTGITSNVTDLRFSASGNEYEGNKSFTMPYSDLTLTVGFALDLDVTYTLYVTYGEGGTAKPREFSEFWPGNTGNKYNVEDFKDDSGKKIGYMIKGLRKGDNVIIEATPNSRSSLKKWAYSFAELDVTPVWGWGMPRNQRIPEIINIIMPAEDLTVTAVFTWKSQKSPSLTIQSNNPEWGEAYTTDDNGDKTEMGKEYEAKVKTTGYSTWPYNIPQPPINIPEDNKEYKITVGNKYILMPEAKEGYHFDHWETSTDDVVDENNTIQMPNNTLVVIAVFAPDKPKNEYKIKVISNNYLWGDAYLVVNNNTSNPISWKISDNDAQANNAKEGEIIDSSKTYTVYFKPRSSKYRYVGMGGASFADKERTPRNPIEAVKFQEAYLNMRINGGNMTVELPEKIESDIFIVVNFSPYESNRLTLKSIPSAITEQDDKEDRDYVWTINYNETRHEYYTTLQRIFEGDDKEFTVHATDETVTITTHKRNSEGKYEANQSKWEFDHWNKQERWTNGVLDYFGYRILDEHGNYRDLTDEDYEYGPLYEYVSYQNVYTDEIRGKDVIMTAVFKELEDDEDDVVDPEGKYYNLHVIKIGRGRVVDENGDEVTIRRLPDLSKITLTAIPDVNATFGHWTVEGDDYYDSIKRFKISGRDLYVTVYFSDDIPGKEEEKIDKFKIISVRDLRWKDYFVDKSGKETGLTYGTPLSNSVMLPKPKNATKDISEVKMGYAVEFELTTVNVPSSIAIVVIKPTILQNGKEISLDKVYDYTSGVEQPLAEYFKKIIINGNNTEPDSKYNYKTKYQTLATPISESNNGISINKIKWNWLYYLPANIWFKGATKDPITIKFEVDLYEDSVSSSNHRENLVTFEKTYNHSKWDGDVYKYSMKESLLDDIYNNATN